MQFYRRVGFFGALTLTLATFGCGGGGGSSSNSTPNGPTSSSLFITKPTGVGTLTATLSQDKARVALNGTVTYTMSLTNPSSASAAQTVVAKIDDTLSPTPPVTLVVLDPSGSVAVPTVPPKADTKLDPPPPPGVQTVTLQPGQSLSVTSRRVVFGKRGVYQATATFSVSPAASITAKSVVVGPLPVTIF